MKIGVCVIARAPVAVSKDAGNWLLWWVPLPQTSGKPFEYIQMRVTVDSRNCAAIG